jgi:hypothetical protein
MFLLSFSLLQIKCVEFVETLAKGIDTLASEAHGSQSGKTSRKALSLTGSMLLLTNPGGEGGDKIPLDSIRSVVASPYDDCWLIMCHKEGPEVNLGFESAHARQAVILNLRRLCDAAVGRNGLSVTWPALPKKSAPQAPPKRASMVLTCTALFDNVPDDGDELAFKVGDKIEILKKDESGWWEGRLRGKKGIFPSNFVEEG